MTQHAKSHDVIGIVGWLTVTFSAAAIGARASIQAEAFYGQLDQPAWAPPAWLFGPVWTALYAFMAIAAWLVWRSGGLHNNRVALALFVVQLALNALWSWLFFAWNLGALALAEVLVLWGFIAATLAAFWRVRPVAGFLLVPYLVWVSFAAALNYTLWQQNPQLFG